MKSLKSGPKSMKPDLKSLKSLTPEIVSIYTVCLATGKTGKPGLCREIEWPGKKTGHCRKFRKKKENPGISIQILLLKKKYAKSVFAFFFQGKFFQGKFFQGKFFQGKFFQGKFFQGKKSNFF